MQAKSAALTSVSLATRTDYRHCQQLLAVGSKSFAWAGLLLPNALRLDAAAVYGFCRQADDCIDHAQDPAAGLALLHERLARIYAQQPAPHDSVEKALAQVVARHQLPQGLFLALLEGFAWDAAGKSYDTWEDVLAYAARVAGTVGALMTWLVGQRSPKVLAAAINMGMAMQCWNIARDVGEDARAKRCYLPKTWCDEVGLQRQRWLEQPSNSPALAQVTGRLLLEAELLYRDSEPMIAYLPARSRWAMLAAASIYRQIGAEILANGYDNIHQRAYVPWGRKCLCVAQALGTSLQMMWHKLPPLEQAPPVCPQAAFLLQACPL